MNEDQTPKPTYSKNHSRHLKTLRRRLNFLSSRLNESSETLSYDRAEKNALEYALEFFESFEEVSKDSSIKAEDTLKTLRRRVSGNNPKELVEIAKNYRNNKGKL